MGEFKKLLFLLLGAAVFIAFVGFLFNKDKNSARESRNTVDIKIGNTNIKAVLANNAESRKKGLGGTDKLEENEGMLFVFDKKDVMPVFWMKDMQIAIDILWINDGEIIQIDKNLEPPNKNISDKDLARYSPQKTIDYALEVNAGFSDKTGIKVGDNIEIPGI